MGFLGGQGLPGLLGTLTNGANVLFNMQMMDKAMKKQDELLGKAEDRLGGVTSAYDKYFPQIQSAATQGYADAAANTEAMRRQNESDRGQALSQWANLTNNTVAGMNQDQQRLLGDYDSRFRTMEGQFQDRLNTGMGLLEGQGEQGRRDIKEAARVNAAAAQQQLARSGFGGGQFLAGVQTGKTREEAAATNRLNELLGAQKFDAYKGLSGDLMGARERGLADRTNLDTTLTQNRQKTQQGMNVEGFNLGQDYADKGMNLLAQQGADKAAYNQNLQNILNTQANAYSSAAGNAANLYAGYNVQMPDLSGALSGLANDLNGKGASLAQQKMQRRAEPDWWESWGSGAVGIGLTGIPWGSFDRNQPGGAPTVYG